MWAPMSIPTLQALPLAMPLIAFGLPACYVLSDIRLQNVGFIAWLSHTLKPQ